MTDEDYVAELRTYGMLSTNKAADRIEALTAERDRLQKAITDAGPYLERGLDKMAFNIIRAALKGETP